MSEQRRLLLFANARRTTLQSDVVYTTLAPPNTTRPIIADEMGRHRIQDSVDESCTPTQGHRVNKVGPLTTTQFVENLQSACTSSFVVHSWLDGNQE